MRHALCTVFGMESVTAQAKSDSTFVGDSVPDLERECAAWDWARTAGVSAAELRQALREALRGTRQAD